MPKIARINGPRAAFLRRFLPLLLDFDKGDKPTGQVTNEKRKEFYDCTTRALVLCFGYENTLGNDSPGDLWDTTYDEIPAANKMPKLPEPESIERDTVIKALTPVVHTWYKNRRTEANSPAGRAVLTQRQVERTVQAFAPLAPPPKALDVYQREFKQDYIDAFAALWAKKLEAAGTDEDALKVLKRQKGGKERAFAAMRWDQESDLKKKEVVQRCKDVYADVVKRHKSLWGSPHDALPNSRMWSAISFHRRSA
ncbi:hypothetical protein PENSPDRAFT_694182 [Peniophora sp. CONT]|nr:hypothetical protein PENSPDRAFT_694182 [Peniophora sp. CONT]